MQVDSHEKFVVVVVISCQCQLVAFSVAFCCLHHEQPLVVVC